MYYCRAEDGRITVLATYVDHILLTEDYEEEVQGMLNRLLKIYEGRDLGMPDKLTDGNRQGDQTRPSTVHQEHRH